MKCTVKGNKNYYCILYINYHKKINLIGQWVKIRSRDYTGQKSYPVKKKSYSTPSEASQVFPPELSFFDRKTSEALGTHYLQATVTMWFLNVRDNVPMDLKCVCQQYFTYMCFLGFIWYNKTFIACGYRKCEKLFTHEYHILLGEYDTLGWIKFHISLTSMQ